jgi:hypothetical protein
MKRGNKKKKESILYQKNISFLHDRNLIAQNFVHFQNKKWNYK